MQHTIPIRFEDIAFVVADDTLILRFYTYYEATIPFKALEDIGSFSLHKDEESGSIHSLTFTIESDETFEDVQKDVSRELNGLINQAFAHLTHKITKKPTHYLHQNLGIPLIGLLFIGIVDRDTSLIEVKPSTGCNLNCIYCSVDEGTDSKKQMDFVVEEEFMVEELRAHLIEKLTMRAKVNDPIDYEIHIGTHGEPLLYEPLIKLVRDIKNLEEDAMIERLGGRIKTISIDTNGVLLNPTKVDALIKAGLNQFNISLNALSNERASVIAGTSYNASRVLDTVEYITAHYLADDATDVRVLLSPIYLSQINEEEIEAIIALIKRLREKYNTTHLLSGIQNFLKYRTGRNPTKELSWKKFYSILTRLEEKYDVPLRLSVEHFGIVDTEPIPRPFKRDEVVTDARYLFSGENSDEAVCSARDRLILVRGAKSPKDCKKIKVIRTKHNVFTAVPEK
jgi:uncharacterized Fe-S cluster-containing radical SAM superfamily enzyme